MWVFIDPESMKTCIFAFSHVLCSVDIPVELPVEEEEGQRVA